MKLVVKNLLLPLVLGLALLGGDLWAQQAPPPPGRGPRREQQVAPRGRGPGPNRAERPLRQLFLRVAPLPPEEQQRLLESDPLFQRLPPGAREGFLRRLGEFNAMPAERRRLVLERWQRARRAQQEGQALFLRVAPLPPAEQPGVLESDEFFQRLPPPVQERFRQHLRMFNSRPAEERRRMLEQFQRFAELSPEEQERMRRRAQLFARMSPEQRRQAQRIFSAWQQLPPEQRQLVTQRLQRLQRASPGARAALLEDPEFLSPLDENQRQLLRELLALREHLPAEPAPPLH